MLIVEGSGSRSRLEYGLNEKISTMRNVESSYCIEHLSPTRRVIEGIC